MSGCLNTESIVKKIDLNCDMGEHFGVYRIPVDEDAIMQLISSINIACGFHAGDPHVMHKTVEKALKYNINIGAHPGFPDLLGFGRRNIAITAKEAYDLILYQVGALWAFVQAKGAKLHHVKPHGALYNQAAKDRELAKAIAQAVHDFDDTLILYSLSGSELIKAGENLGLKVANEVFADRTYQEYGTLTPRSHQNCFVETTEQAVAQVLSMVKENKVKAVTGCDIHITAETICVHGDVENAVAFVQVLQKTLKNANITISGR